MYKTVLSLDGRSLKTPTPQALIMRGTLPFVPAVNMIIVMNDGPDEVLLQVEEIQWRKPFNKEDYFVVTLVDIYKNYTRLQVRDAYKSDGWSIEVD